MFVEHKNQQLPTPSLSISLAPATDSDVPMTGGTSHLELQGLALEPWRRMRRFGSVSHHRRLNHDEKTWNSRMLQKVVWNQGLIKLQPSQTSRVKQAAPGFHTKQPWIGLPNTNSCSQSGDHVFTLLRGEGHLGEKLCLLRCITRLKLQIPTKAQAN